MNNTALLYGLICSTLCNRVPIIQVFIWAVNSQPWLSHKLSRAKRRECTFGHSRSTEAPSAWQAHHSPLKPVELGPAPWKPAVQLQYEEPCFLLEVSLLLLLFPSWQADDAGAVLLSWQLTPVTWFDLMLRFKTKLRSTAGHVREGRLVWFTWRVVWGPETPCSSGSTVAPV